MLVLSNNSFLPKYPRHVISYFTKPHITPIHHSKIDLSKFENINDLIYTKHNTEISLNEFNALSNNKKGTTEDKND